MPVTDSSSNVFQCGCCSIHGCRNCLRGIAFQLSQHKLQPTGLTRKRWTAGQLRISQDTVSKTVLWTSDLMHDQDSLRI